MRPRKEGARNSAAAWSVPAMKSGVMVCRVKVTSCICLSVLSHYAKVVFAFKVYRCLQQNTSERYLMSQMAPSVYTEYYRCAARRFCTGNGSQCASSAGWPRLHDRDRAAWFYRYQRSLSRCPVLLQLLAGSGRERMRAALHIHAVLAV